MIDSPSWRPGKGLRTLREFDFEDQWDLVTEFPQNWGNRILKGTTSVERVCNFLGCVSLQQRVETVDRCYSLVTAQNFIRQTKDSTPSMLEDRPTSKERPQSILVSSFYTFCLPSPAHNCLRLPCANWASQEGGVFVQSEVLTPIHGFYFTPFS